MLMFYKYYPSIDKFSYIQELGLKNRFVQIIFTAYKQVHYGQFLKAHIQKDFPTITIAGKFVRTIHIYQKLSQSITTLVPSLMLS